MGKIDALFSFPQTYLNFDAGEGEMLFPPLSHLEVVGSPKVEMHDNKPVIVVRIKVNINPKTMTLEEILGRRKQTVRAIGEGIINDVDFDLKLVSKNPRPTAQLKQRISVYTDSEAVFFNNDSFFQRTLDEILKLKKTTYISYVETEVDSSDIEVNILDCWFYLCE